MNDREDFFEEIYKLTEAEQTAAHYAKFADTYEDTMRENSYVTPMRCAEALKSTGIAVGTPILDIGCGSGLSGRALAETGFTVIDGIDFSPEMLELAHKTGIYRNLSQDDLRGASYDNSYAAVVAAGVLNPAHAPASTLDDILNVLTPGGVFVFSLNDHAIADGSYEGRIHETTDCGIADLLAREYGEHMPGQDLKAWVYTLRKR